jgi:hypothetical protein
MPVKQGSGIRNPGRFLARGKRPPEWFAPASMPASRLKISRPCPCRAMAKLKRDPVREERIHEEIIVDAYGPGPHHGCPALSANCHRPE